MRLPKENLTSLWASSVGSLAMRMAICSSRRITSSTHTLPRCPATTAQNLRKLYLLNANYADLSFFFTILAGEKHNAHLDAEYLAVLETDNATPYFLNLHNGEVPHTLILGMTGSGKSYFCNFVLQNAQKYNPLTFIFDIGGSFQSLTSIFGGSYLNVGQESRDFAINPFSLPPTKDNLQFLFSFFRVLIEGNDDRYRMDFKEERKLWDAIERHVRTGA